LTYLINKVGSASCGIGITAQADRLEALRSVPEAFALPKPLMRPQMKPVAIYARVSTTDQNTQGQIDELRAWLGRNSIAPEAAEYYVDHETGSKLDRLQFNRLRKDIDTGGIKTVVVWKLDRIGRNMLDGMTLLASWTDKGVRVVSTTQAIDVSGTMGKIMAAVLFGFAQIETEYRRERQAAGITAAKRRGIYRGRKAGTTKAQPDRAKALRAKGLQIEEIATALGASVRTVHRYLK
jgi:DNA invertase Pin-like site-specific DNA recombinase